VLAVIMDGDTPFTIVILEHQRIIHAHPRAAISCHRHMLRGRRRGSPEASSRIFSSFHEIVACERTTCLLDQAAIAKIAEIDYRIAETFQ
jgi:hypothetical protein